MKQQNFPDKNSGEGDCPLVREETTALLLNFAAGRLDGTRAGRVSRHALHCDACTEFIAGQTAVWSALEEWEMAPVSPSFNRRFWNRVAELDRAPWYTRFADALRFGWKPAIPVAAVVLVVAAGFLMDHRDITPARRSASGNSVSIMEVDQMERSLDDLQLLKQLDTTVTDTASTRTRM